MAKSADLAAAPSAQARADQAREWPRPPADRGPQRQVFVVGVGLAPGWMAWVPWAALLWSVGYGSVRVWWAIHGAPGSGPLHLDLMFFSGWGAVGLCAAAILIALALRIARWWWPLLIVAWVVCAAHLVACPILLLDLVGGLLPGLGVAFNPAAFLSRAACLIEGILIGATAVAYHRRWCSACLFCGRTDVRAPLAQTPRWAWWAAYAAVAGCLVRLGAQLAVGFGMTHPPPGTSAMRFATETLLFEASFLLAGTVLPLALVHSWGRLVPGWMPLLAGRRVPRWLLLGPAFAISALMTVYFGITFMKIIADTLSGTWHQTFGTFPPAFFWVAVPAYWIWGLGLGTAAIAHYRATRHPCRVCGRP